MSKESFMLGFIAGVTSVGGVAQKEPVAYSYNGVVLPKLPERNTTVYPYALMFALSDFYAEVYYSTVPLYLKSEHDLGSFGIFKRFCAKEDGECVRYCKDSSSINDPDNWKLCEEEAVISFVADGDIFGLTYTNSYPRWANYNVRKVDDDSVYLAASDPIPVYE